MVAEVAIPIGLWTRELRYPAIIGGLILHLTFELFLNVHLFGLTMCVGLIAFVPPQGVIAVSMGR
jgi:hypothetical protein